MVSWFHGVVLLLVGALVAGGLGYLHPGVGADGLVYLIPIHHWMAGQGYTVFGKVSTLYPPGYGVVAWLLYQVVPDLEYAGMGVSMLAYAGLAPLVFLLFRGISRVGAWLAAWLILAQPVLIGLATATLTESLFTLILVISFYLSWRLWHEPTSIRIGAALGAAFGCGYLVRPEMLGIGALTIVVLLLFRVRSFRGTAWLGVVVAGGILAWSALSYGWFLKESTGTWSISSKGALTMRDVERQIDGRYSDARLVDYRLSLLDYLRQLDPELLKKRLRLNAWKERQELWAGMRPTLLLLAVVGGWALWGWRRPGADPPESGRQVPSRGYRIRAELASSLRAFGLPMILLVLPFMLPLGVYLVFFIVPRYVMPYQTILILVGALMAGRWLERFPGRLTPPWRWGVAWMVAMGGVVWFHGQELATLYTAPHAHQGLREAGIWLSSRSESFPPDQVTSSWKGIILDFYARGKTTRLAANPDLATLSHDQRRTASLPAMVEELRRRGYRHLVLDATYTFSAPALAELWRHPDRGAAAGMRLVHRDPAGSFMLFSVKMAEEPPS